VYSITGNIRSENTDSARVVAICIVDGFLFYVLTFFTMHLSDGYGGYFNPSLTLSLYSLDVWFDRATFWTYTKRLAWFLSSQFLGATLGALLVLLSMPNPLSHGMEKLGYSKPMFGTDHVAAFLFEVAMGFFFTLLMFSVRNYERRRSSIILAFAYIAIRLFSFPMSGGYANPARSFGTAFAAGEWSEYWIYFLGSPIGALAGTFAFIFLHKPQIAVRDDFRELNEEEDF
jgi:glycerol uptake facilitator-like aquaporin